MEVSKNIEKEEIVARYTWTRYSLEKTDFSVNIYQTEDGKKITVRGSNLPTNKKLYYRFMGKYENSKKYGLQFVADSYIEVINNDKDGIINYLSCGIIKGIGVKTAEKIYDKFGKKTVQILEDDPSKLLAIKGITQTKLEKIIESYKENRGSRDVMTYLMPFKISTRACFSVYSKYGISSMNTIKTNPYKLCNIRGINFEIADCIAKTEKLPMNSMSRFKACADFVLAKNEKNGNIGMEQNSFGFAMYENMRGPCITEKLIEQYTIELVRIKEISFQRIEINGRMVGIIFRPIILKKENEIAEKMVRLNLNEKSEIKNIDALISRAEKKLQIKLDEVQKKAVKEALEDNVHVITGGPGTGKTTIIQVVACIYEWAYPENQRVFLAPTGKAARRIKESTGNDARTVHSYLGITDSDAIKKGEELEDPVLVNDSLVVVDEFSMMDVWITSSLMDALQDNVKLIIVGDVKQLPSVGPGAILRDIIKSRVVGVTMLTKLYRQSENSNICINCQKMSEGKTDLTEGEDFIIHEMNDMYQIQKVMVKDYVESVNVYGIENVVCLCPFKKHYAGIYEMNKAIQEKINPAKYHGQQELHHNNETFREKDIVMQLKNSDCVANGDIGQVIGFSKGDKEIEMVVSFFSGKIVTYSMDRLEELTLGYALTIHKCQGSEYDKVITCLTKFHGNKKNGGFLKRNIPYTGFSRAKKLVSFYGEKEALVEAIKNTYTDNRITVLAKLLKYYSGEYIKVC